MAYIPSGPPQRSRRRPRTPAERARIASIRKAVFHDVAVLDLVLGALTDQTRQLRLLNVLRFPLANNDVIMLKAIESFCKQVAHEFSHAKIHPVAPAAQDWMYELDGYGVMCRKEEVTKDMCAVAIHKRMVRHRAQEAQEGRLITSPSICSRERIRELLDRAPLEDWLGGYASLNLYFSLFEQYRRGVTPLNDYDDDLTEFATREMNRRPDEPPSPYANPWYDDPVEKRHPRLFKLCLEACGTEMHRLYTGAKNEPWREWLELLCDDTERYVDNLMDDIDYFHVTYRDYYARVGYDLFTQLRNHTPLKRGHAMRLWPHFYAESAWRLTLFVTDVQEAGGSQDFLETHRFYFLIPNTALTEAAQPRWAVNAAKEFDFIIQQGEWSQEVRQNAYIYPSGRLAMVKK